MPIEPSTCAIAVTEAGPARIPLAGGGYKLKLLADSTARRATVLPAIPIAASARQIRRSGVSCRGSRRSSITAGPLLATARSNAAAKSASRSTVSPCAP